MQKKVFSVKNSNFNEMLNDFIEARRTTFLEAIQNLENYENGVPEAKKPHGKVLSSQNCNKIYTLELPGWDRAIAVIVEKDDKKIYAWFWGGSHEEYSKKLDTSKLKKAERTVPIKAEPQIIEKIEAIELERKALMLKNIEDMRKQYTGTNSHGKKSSNRLK